MLAFMMYADRHGRFPESFDQASAFWPKGIKPETGVSSDQFEIVYSGPRDSINENNVSHVIVIREKEPQLHEDGKFSKSYALADGSVQTLAVPFTWTDANGEKTTFATSRPLKKGIFSRHQTHERYSLQVRHCGCPRARLRGRAVCHSLPGAPRVARENALGSGANRIFG